MRIPNSLLFGSVLVWGASCMDPLHNYNECVEIETARCDARAACLENEAFRKSYPDFDEDTCIAYAKEHCRTRKIAGDDWDQLDVDKCVVEINDLSQHCEALMPRGVNETEDLGACWFIDGKDTAAPETNDTGKDTDSEPDTNLSDAGD